MSDENKEKLIEDFLNREDDPGEQARKEKDLLAPAGTYTTVPPLVFTPNVPDDGVNKGRFTMRFFGPAVLERDELVLDKTTGEKVKQRVRREARFGFGMSPEQRLKDNGDPDNSTKLYTYAKVAYRQAYGQDATGPRDIAEFIQKYPVRLRVIQVGLPTERNPEPDGEPGNVVMQISAVKENT